MASTKQETEITCSLCNAIFKNPKLLPCLHTYCQNCLVNQLKSSNNPGNRTCKLCKETFQLQEESVSNLKANTKVSVLIRLHQLKVSGHMCVVCNYKQEEEDAVMYCLDCGDMMCKMCSGHHTFTRLTISHRVVELADIRSGKHDDFLCGKLSELCNTHIDMMIKFYCKSCTVYLCEDCLQEHHKHDLIRKEETESDDTVRKVQALYDGLKQRHYHSLELKHAIEMHIKEVEGNELTIHHDVTKFCDDMQDCIRKTAQHAQNSATSELLESKRKLLAYKSTTDAFVKTIKPIYDVCSKFSSLDLLHRLPVEDILIDRLTSLGTIEQPSLKFGWGNIDVNLQSAMVDPVVLFTFSKSKQNLSRTDNGMVTSTPDGSGVDPSKPPLTSAANTNGRSAENVKAKDQKHDADDQSKLAEKVHMNTYKLESIIPVKTFSDEVKPKITSVAWLSSSSFVVSDKNNNHISVYSTDGCCLWTQPVKNPLGVSCIGNVIVCSSNNDLIFFKNNTVLTRVKTKMNAIRVAADDSLFTIASPAENRLKTFNTKGENVGETTVEENIKISMLSSSGKTCIASDWSQHSVVFIDKQSGRMTNRHCFSDHRWGHPGATCADDKCILVADYHMHRIHVLTKEDGTYLKYWSLKPSICHPIGLSFHRSGRLLVGGDNKIAIYTKTS